MRFTFISLAAALMLAGCGSSDEQAAPPAVPVRTYTVTAQEMPNVIELPGRVTAVRTAEVRARVTGILQRRLYTEGTDVTEGQPLFRIDPSEMQASYAQSEASLDRAKATAANARAVVERYRPLVDENAISRQEYDAAVAAMREADANVAQLQAELRAAGLQLGYTTVRAPISGRAGRAQVTEGALVSQTEGTLLTTIEQISPVYVTFNQSATEIVKMRQRVASGEIDLKDGQRVEVELFHPDGSEYPVKGYIDFLAFSVEESTGTIEVRAEVPNPTGLLIPGEFVRGRMFVGKRPNAISVPQRAVTLSGDGGSVFVVTGEGTAESRKVELGEMIDGSWIITSGLKAGDQVIVTNLQNLRSGSAVKIANTPTGQQPAAKGAAPAQKAAAPASKAN